MKNPLSALHSRRAAAHRAMAFAALRSNSSLSVRRKRYNEHMEKARAAARSALSLEAKTQAVTHFQLNNEERSHA